jgi:glycosyltransferase involved in cell wall biosynthesis
VLVVHNRYRYAGGEDAVVYAEAAVLRERGHRVIEFTRDNSQIAEFGRIDRASLAATAVWNQRVYSEVRALIRRERPAVAHCHNLVPLLSPAVYYACRDEGVPVVQTLHNFRLRCPAGTMFRDGKTCNDCDRNLARGVVHGCYRRSRTQTAVAAMMLAAHRWLRTFSDAVDAYSAPSRFCAEVMASAGIPSQKIAVRQNFLAADPGVRRGIGSYAIFVGRICEEKGIRQLLAAWRKLPHIPLVVVGDGPLLDEARRTAASNVSFTGALPPSEVVSRIKSARFLVFPSIWHETFGMVALEAAACGVATLGSRLGAIPELVQEGRTGLLFDPYSPNELADKAAWAWEHPDAMNEMGSAARDCYLQRHTAEHGYASLMALYRSLGAAAAAAIPLRAALT